MEKIIFCLDENCQEYWDEEKPDCKCGEKDYQVCKNYYGIKNTEGVGEIKGKSNADILSLPWHSNALGALDIGWLTSKKQPLIIGIIGQSNAGKTTFLATLYMLLRGGHSIGENTFAGSYTLLGWEKIADFLSFHSHKKVHFPPHTSSNAARLPGLLHLLLKDRNGQFQDIIFTDAPGQWFETWAIEANSDESKGARWIAESSDAFLLVADTEAFSESFGEEKEKFLAVVERMRKIHQNRPCALVYTKSDIGLDEEDKKEVLTQVKRNIPNVKPFDVAAINLDSEDLLHNILNLTDYLLTEKYHQKNLKPEIEIKNMSDFFFSIRIDNYARE
jgi:Double-GTPase 2